MWNYIVCYYIKVMRQNIICWNRKSRQKLLIHCHCTATRHTASTTQRQRLHEVFDPNINTKYKIQARSVYSWCIAHDVSAARCWHGNTQFGFMWLQDESRTIYSSYVIWGCGNDLSITATEGLNVILATFVDVCFVSDRWENRWLTHGVGLLPWKHRPSLKKNITNVCFKPLNWNLAATGVDTAWDLLH